MRSRPRTEAQWFTHRPTAVQAVQYLPDSVRECKALLNGWACWFWAEPDGRLGITTPQGPKTVNYGDWLVRGVTGEVWPCRDEVFTESYTLGGVPPR